MDYRDEINKLIQKIPESVAKGGLMTATMWKQKAVTAYDLARSPKSSKEQLQRVLDELRRF
jgi:flagellar motor switch protein FliM